MFITKKRFKKLEEFTLTKIGELDTHIAKQKIINKQILETLEAFNKSINELERIVQNQPLIKKYQKTLDIFLKNAQDKPVPLPIHCCTGMTMEDWEEVKNNK